MKICFITAMFGSVCDTPAPSFFKNPDHDYFLFTDVDANRFNTDWQIVNIKDHPRIKELDSNPNAAVRKSRYPKFMSWELLESLGKTCDFVGYCDGHMAPVFQNWSQITDKIQAHDFGFLQSIHHNKDVLNGGILREVQEIVKHRKDSKERIEKTIHFFQQYDPSVRLDYPQYFENNRFMYKFQDEKFRQITSEFWDIYTKEDITYRDQPLWNYLLLKNNLKPLVHTTKILFQELGRYGFHSY